MSSSRPAQTLKHQYKFTNDFTDSVAGQWDGAWWADDHVHRADRFPGGGNDYISLPAATIAINGANYVTNGVSFEAWFTLDTVNNWQRIFDFGSRSTANFNNGGHSVFYAPTAPLGGTPVNGNRAAIANPIADGPGFDNEAQTTGAQLVANQQYHSVVILDADSIALWTNGN